MVERIGRGEEVDIAAEAPPLEFGDDQIGNVGQAFNAVQRTAINYAAAREYRKAQERRYHYNHGYYGGGYGGPGYGYYSRPDHDGY